MKKDHLLVVNLPSEHEGGELIVSHGGQSRTYSFADSDGFHPAFVAFYADCYHEVKPVTSGYRINLIYNLGMVPWVVIYTRYLWTEL